MGGVWICHVIGEAHHCLIHFLFAFLRRRIKTEKTPKGLGTVVRVKKVRRHSNFINGYVILLLLFVCLHWLPCFLWLLMMVLAGGSRVHVFILIDDVNAKSCLVFFFSCARCERHRLQMANSRPVTSF